jgi:hypothetical protein
MRYPVVRDLAAHEFPVRPTCGLLGFTSQTFYKWLAKPRCDRDWHDTVVTNALIDVHRDDWVWYRFPTEALIRIGLQLDGRRV